MSPIQRFLVQLAALGICVVGCVALLGHVIEKRALYMWMGEPGMAIETAICFIVTAACLSILSKPPPS